MVVLLKFLAIVVFTTILTSATFSVATAEKDPPAADESEALAEKLLVALNAEHSFEENVRSMALAQVQAQPDLAIYADIFEQFYRKYLGYQAIRGGLIEGYVERFSKQELAQLVEFYESDIGRKSTKFSPQIATKALQEATRMSQANAAELQEMVEAKAELLNMQ